MDDYKCLQTKMICFLVSSGYPMERPRTNESIVEWFLERNIFVSVNASCNSNGLIFFGVVTDVIDDTFSQAFVSDETTETMAKIGLFAPKIFTDNKIAFIEAVHLALTKLPKN